MEFANIYYDPEDPDQMKQVQDIKLRLGTLGISCVTGELYFDEYYSAPTTPWLEINDHIYYSNQISNALDNISDENNP